MIPINNKIHIFISGSIGVGKTTAIKTFMDNFKDVINVYRIQEYIDYDPNGEERFNDWRNGDLSLLGFQQYILDQFEEQLNTPEYDYARVIIWERHPEETKEIFCVNMPKEDMNILDERLETLSKCYSFPRLDKRKDFIKMQFNTIDISDIFAADTIYDLVKLQLNDTMNKFLPLANFIFFYIPNEHYEEQYERIVKRGRETEVYYYKVKKNLEEINNLYFDFMDTIGFN